MEVLVPGGPNFEADNGGACKLKKSNRQESTFSGLFELFAARDCKTMGREVDERHFPLVAISPWSLGFDRARETRDAEGGRPLRAMCDENTVNALTKLIKSTVFCSPNKM